MSDYVENKKEPNASSKKDVLYSLLVEIGVIVPVIGIGKLIIVLSILGLPLNWKPLLTMALVTIPVYFGDRLFVDEEDKENEHKFLRNRLLAKFNFLFKIIVIVSFVLFEVLVWTTLSISQSLVLQIPLGVFLLYPKLKEYRYLDTLAIGFAWSTELLAVAVFFAQEPVPYRLAVFVFLIMFVMKLAETELSNIRDIEGDVKAGNETFPSIYGENKTRFLIMLFLGISFGGIAFFSTVLPIKLAAVFSGGTLIYVEEKITPELARKTIFIDRTVKLLFSIFVLIISYSYF